MTVLKMSFDQFYEEMIKVLKITFDQFYTLLIVLNKCQYIDTDSEIFLFVFTCYPVIHHC